MCLSIVLIQYLEYKVLIKFNLIPFSVVPTAIIMKKNNDYL